MLLLKAIWNFLLIKEYRELLLTTVIILIFGSITFHYLEGWCFFDAFYFCVITLTTIGYGDLYPITFSGKLFNLVYILFGLGLILSFIKTVYDHFENIKIEHKKKQK
jgi:hypothetical protein